MVPLLQAPEKQGILKALIITHMKKLTTPLVALLLLAAACNKQDAKSPDAVAPEATEAEVEPGRQCASHEILEQQLAADPERRRNLEELERFTEMYKKGQAGALRTAGERLYIPVVVNVVLKNNTQVTDAQIQRQIDVLNADFNANNSELDRTNLYLAGYDPAMVANCDIEFYLQGVYRKETTSTFGSNDAVKKSSQGGLDPTNATSALNMWVCDLSSGLLGYAQFPGGSASTDGVVIDYQAFGTNASYPMYSVFNLGRTATHEVGHWLNLRHIWGDRRCGDDLVGDTPQHDGSNGGCPSTTSRSKCSGRPLEMWMNYMDYTDDRCMYMFTSGQKGRMDAAIDGARKGYFSTAR